MGILLVRVCLERFKISCSLLFHVQLQKKRHKASQTRRALVDHYGERSLSYRIKIALDSLVEDIPQCGWIPHWFLVLVNQDGADSFIKILSFLQNYCKEVFFWTKKEKYTYVNMVP